MSASASAVVLNIGATRASASGAFTWAAPVHFESAPIANVTCVSSTLCVGSSGGDIVASSNPASTAWTVISNADGSRMINSVACASSTFCIAVDSAGHAITSTNPAAGPWSDPFVLNDTYSDSPITNVACPSTTFCIAVLQGNHVLTTDAPSTGNWTASESSIDANDSRINALACPSTTLCIAADSGGYVMTSLSPSAPSAMWTTTTQSIDPSGIAGLSCPSTSLCVAVEQGHPPTNGAVLSTTNPAATSINAGSSDWSAATVIDPASLLTAIACPSTALCIATDGMDSALTSTTPTSTTWVTSTEVDSTPITSVACPSVTLCVIADATGNIVTGQVPQDQTITFTSTPPSPALVSGTYSPTAIGGGSSQPVVFSIDSTSTAGACSYSAGVVTFLAVGTCIVDANQLGSPGFNPATQNKQNISVTLAVNTLPSTTTTSTTTTTTTLPPSTTTTTTTTTTLPPSTTTTTTLPKSAPSTTTTTTTIPPASTTTTTAVPTTTTTTTTTTIPPSDTTTTLPTDNTTTTTSVPDDTTDTTLPSPPDGDVNIDLGLAPGISIAHGKVHIKGQGFRPGSRIHTSVHSKPVDLGSVAVGRNGKFLVSTQLPANLPVGAHHLIVSGTLRSGKNVQEVEAFTVAPGGVLGSVGSIPPGPLVKYVAFVPKAHSHTVITTAAGSAIAIGAVGSAIGGGFSGGARGGPRGGTGGGGSGGGGGRSGNDGAGYLQDVELERQERQIRGGGSGPLGDRSRSWRWPGTRHLDNFSKTYPTRLAALSPVAGRVVIDGDYLRAMFGSLWFVLCAFSVGLGLYAAASTDWYAIPPVLWVFLAVLGLSVFDATLGYLAGIAFFLSALVAGHITTTGEIRAGMGVVLLWFAVPLAAAALRPLRRNVERNLASLWDRSADLIIGGLFAAWVAQKMTGALSPLGGFEFPIAKDVNAVAFAVLGFVAARIILETIAAHHYPGRLERVRHDGELGSQALQVGLSLIVQIVLFIFISISFLGSTWGLYIGTMVFFAPLIPWLFIDKIPKSEFLTKWRPRGLVKWTFILATGALLGELLQHTISNHSLLEAAGFIVLPVPVLICWALELFEVEEVTATLSDGTQLIVGDHHDHDQSGDDGHTSFDDHQDPHAEGTGVTSGRSRLRNAEAARRLQAEDERLEGSPRFAWMTRLAGLPLVVVSVYLVVAHLSS